MLEVLGLRAGHDGGEVVHGVSLDVARGEVVALLGANGAGKSTLLRAVCGLLPASGGAVRLAGRDVLGVPTHELARRGLSFVPAERHLFPAMTVADHLVLGAYPGRPSSADLAHVHALFPRLAERAGQAAGTLSGGEQQMLAVGRALVRRPALLVLDEPTTGLAPALAREVRAALAALADAGAGVLLAEQHVRAALDLASRGYVLEEGRVVLADRADALADAPSVRRAYLGRG